MNPWSELAQRDPIMGTLVEAFGPLKLRARRAISTFGTLSRMIAGQQLSSKAAATIFGRYQKLIPGKNIHDCRFVAEVEMQELRNAGLSFAKAKFIRELALAACEGRLPEIKQLRRMPETAVREALLQFNGIGPWTVEMFEIFVLGKGDVISLHDAGIRRGFELAYQTRAAGKKGLIHYSKIWSPYCSTASLYLWAVADNPKKLKTADP